MLDEIRKLAAACERCPLHENRTNSVFGSGNEKAKIMIIGEGPGEQEDLQGFPFVGPAGKLLDNILKSPGVEIPKEEIYITNIVKCRPPGNRTPKMEEMEICSSFLDGQIACIKPRILIILGSAASQFFLGTQGKITKVRGIWFKERGMDMLCTYHPAALLRDEGKKRPVWEDFKKIRQKIDEEGLL